MEYRSDLTNEVIEEILLATYDKPTTAKTSFRNVRFITSESSKLSVQEARVSELLRLKTVAKSGNDVLTYIDGRLEQL